MIGHVLTVDFIGLVQKMLGGIQNTGSYTRCDQSMKSIIDNIDGNRYQSITINQLISEIDDQLMAQKFVFLNCHRLSLIVINCHRLPYLLGR